MIPLYSCLHIIGLITMEMFLGCKGEAVAWEETFKIIPAVNIYFNFNHGCTTGLQNIQFEHLNHTLISEYALVCLHEMWTV